MSIVHGSDWQSMVGDPDDHRPNSTWSLIVDPGDGGSPVDDIAVIRERIASGDRIPLHKHHENEVILIRGPGRFRLGDQTEAVDDGSVVFIPAGIPHGLDNDGPTPLPVDAVFPTTRIWIRYLERNAAPGTEGDPPGSGTYDLRSGDVTFD
jgi:quercetin dioxygenase-like cupin family protein